MFEWFWKGFLKQVARHKIQVQFILIDYWKDERTFDLSNDLGIETLHTLPLPSPWQGKHKITKENWYACANARNTAFVYAIHPTIACCDDLTVLGEDWLTSVIEAHKTGQVVLGAYSKQHDMVVDDGVLVSGRQQPDGRDARIDRFKDVKTKTVGGNFFGCSSVVPLESALRINGFDCLTDSIGYEDGVFGMRLGRDNNHIFYDKRLFTTESNDHPKDDFVVKRVDKMLTRERYFQALNSFGINNSIFKESDNKDCSHLLIEIASNKKESAWNFFSLRELRKIRESREITIEDMKYPVNTWWDNTLLKNDELIYDAR